MADMKKRSTTLKKIGKAIWTAIVGKGMGKLEKAQKDHEATKRKKREQEKKAME